MRSRPRSTARPKPRSAAEDEGGGAPVPPPARGTMIVEQDHGDGAMAPVRRRARPFWRIHFQRRITLWGVLFVLPTLLFFAVFKFGPMVWAIELSFTSYDMVSTPTWVVPPAQAEGGAAAGGLGTIGWTQSPGPKGAVHRCRNDALNVMNDPCRVGLGFIASGLPRPLASLLHTSCLMFVGFGGTRSEEVPGHGQVVHAEQGIAVGPADGLLAEGKNVITHGSAALSESSECGPS